MEPKKGYFARHGQTQFNVERRITGHTDVPLTEKGLEEAREAAKEVPEDCVAIYTADTQRHLQTAEILNEGRNLPVIIDPRLRERHFGSLEGQVWDDADPTGELWEADKNQRYDYRPYGGESVEDVTARVEEFQREMQHKGLAVTSGGVIRLLKNKQHGEVHDTIQNASIHEFELPA